MKNKRLKVLLGHAAALVENKPGLFNTIDVGKIIQRLGHEVKSPGPNGVAQLEVLSQLIRELDAERALKLSEFDVFRCLFPHKFDAEAVRVKVNAVGEVVLSFA